MVGLIGKKIGMTRIFTEQGKHIPVTVVKAGPCPIVQVKSVNRDGYNAIQIAYEQVKEKKVSKPLLGHFKKAHLTAHRRLAELRLDEPAKYKRGDILTVEVFQEGDKLNCTGISKGKGFQGGVRRYGFRGGPKTHGQSDRHRAPGSIGCSSYPARVLKGMKMGGHMGNRKVTVKNLRVVKIIADESLLLVKGALPGMKGSYLFLKRSE